jgi:3-isopropylmalate dehydrogenase
MLLEWLGRRHRRPELEQAAKAIDSAIDAALRDPATRTADLGGKLGTQAFARHVAGLVG